MCDLRANESVPAILVVDDDEISRHLVIKYLDKLNLRNPVVEAKDGDEACAVLSNADLAPVLVLLDQNMPGRNGLEVIKWMRDHPRFADLPVVMLTATSTLAEVADAYSLGVSAYLVKPVGFGALSDVLRQFGLPWLLLPAGT